MDEKLMMPGNYLSADTRVGLNEPQSPERRLMGQIRDLLENGDYTDSDIIKYIKAEIEAFEAPKEEVALLDDDLYSELTRIFTCAHKHASETKGKERHHDDGVRFENQISCWMQRRGYDYARGQAVKKIDESLRLGRDRAIKELYGAMNYCAVAIIALEKRDE